MADPERISTTEARAGSTPHVARYALIWGLLLIVIIFAVLLFVWR
jgi:hypothetical protein